MINVADLIIKQINIVLDTDLILFLIYVYKLYILSCCVDVFCILIAARLVSKA